MKGAGVPSRILSRIVERSGQLPQDGHPLYSYDVSSEDLAALRSELSRSFERLIILPQADAAAFCLFAARWFCERYEGGPWAWEPVFEAVGFRGTMFDLYENLLRGLEGYWRRPLVRFSGRRRFLATIVCEGGLPLRLLKTEGATLQRYVRHVLEGREVYEVPARELAERWCEDVPRSLRTEQVWELVGQLVEAVVLLRTQIPPGTREPIEFLDSSRPAWRRTLPLRLEDSIAKDLLQGLLRLPRAAPERHEKPIAIETSLALGDIPRVERTVRIPPTVRRGSLPAVIGAGVEIPSRSRIWLMHGDGSRSPLALLVVAGDRARLDVLGPAVVPARLVEQESQAIVTSGTSEIARVPLPGGDALGPLPWVFAERRDRLVLVGRGSVRTKDDALVVAVPSDGKSDGGESIGVLALPSGERRVLLRCADRVAISQGDETHVIEPRSGNHEPDRQFAFKCSRTELGPGGDIVWHGNPLVVEYPGRHIIQDALQWRPASGGEWRRGSPLGDVVLRAFVGGHVRLRERATVLPDGFKFKVIPGPAPNQGRIILDGLARSRISATMGAAETSVVQDGGRIEVRCSLAKDQGPDRLTLRALLGSAEITMRCCCPVPCHRFIGPAGTQLPPMIGLDRFLGVRAQVFAIRGQDSYALVAKPPEAGKEVELSGLTSDDSGIAELALDAFRDEVAGMLATSSQLDASVHLRVVTPSEARPRAALEVGHYEAWFIPARDETGVRLVVHGLEPGEEDRLRVLAQPLWRPSSESREPLPCPESGIWRFDFVGRAPGPWLITGWEGDLVRVRPTRLLVPGSTVPLASGLERAVLEPDLARRNGALIAAVDALSRDANHVDWSLALDFVHTLDALPPATFDCVRALVQHSEAMALLALRLSPRGAELDRVARAVERLPFLWTLVPLRSWARAARRFRAAAGEDRFIETPIRNLLEWAQRQGLGSRAMAYVMRSLFPSLDLVPRSLAQDMNALSAMCAVSAPKATGVGRPTPASRPRAEPIQSDSVLVKIAERALGEAIEQAQQQVLRDNAERTWWPAPDVNLLEALPLEIRSVAMAVRVRSPHSHQQPVYDAPLLAAAVCAFGVDLSPSSLMQVRRLRAFHEGHFDHAYDAFLARLLPTAILREQELRP